MSWDSDQLDLLAVLTLLFAYLLAGVLLAGEQQLAASWVAIVGGIVAGVIEVGAILRRMSGH